MSDAAPRTPKQARAAQTRQAVLDAALAILSDQGVEGLNTNAIARQADVRVATVYRYFKDKHDVLTALALQHLERLEHWVANLAATTPDDAAANALGQQLVHGYFALLADQPAVVELRAAMRALPNLRALDEASLDRCQLRLVQLLKQRGTTRKPAELRTAARVLVETICNGADRTLGCAPQEVRRRLTVLGNIVSAYLDQVP